MSHIMMNLRHSVEFSLFVLDLLFDEFLLLLGEVHLVHLHHEFVPSLLLFHLLRLLLGVL